MQNTWHTYKCIHVKTGAHRYMHRALEHTDTCIEHWSTHAHMQSTGAHRYIFRALEHMSDTCIEHWSTQILVYA